MKKLVGTALAGGVVAVIAAAGFSMTGVAQSTFGATERSETMRFGGNREVRFAHAGGGREYGGRHRGKRHGKRGRRMRRVRNMMELYDANDDRKLTTEEVRSGREDQLKRYDRDGDGGINLQEFAPLWAEIRQQRIIRRFQRMDRNGDGKVTEDEFVTPAVRMVERLDRNNDGALSREDRRRRGGFWRRFRGGDDRMDARPGREGPATDRDGNDRGHGGQQ